MPNESMREKMARAMYHAMITRSTYVILDAKDVTLTAHAWRHQSAALQADWLAAADAALDALREPTDEMATAGGPHCENENCFEPEHGADNARGAWQAMIDAASPPEGT